MVWCESIAFTVRSPPPHPDMNSRFRVLSLSALACAAGLALANPAAPAGDFSVRRPLFSWGGNPASIIVDDIPGSGKDLGSGVEFWPEEDDFLVVNNNAKELRRVTPAGTLTGNPVSLTNCWDP